MYLQCSIMFVISSTHQVFTRQQHAFTMGPTEAGADFKPEN